MKTPPAIPAWHPPGWLTVHNAELAGAALVIILLAFAVLRLSKGHRPAPAPVAAPKSSGGSGKVLLIVLAAVAAIFGYAKLGHPAATGAKASPAPSPSPVPHPVPTVTQTVAPHVTDFHFPLTGSQILIGLAVVAIVGYLMVRVVARNAS